MNSNILKARTKAYSISIGKLIIDFSHYVLNKNYSNQLVRCSNSVGMDYRANCSEASKLLPMVVASTVTIRKNEQNRKSVILKS